MSISTITLTPPPDLPDAKQNALKRLKYIEGHLGGVRRMIEQDTYCVDVLKQTFAVRRAIQKLESVLLEGSPARLRHRRRQGRARRGCAGRTPRTLLPFGQEVTSSPMAIRADSRPNSPGDATNVSLNIGGMTCAACVSHVERALREVDGVESSSVNLATERATVQYTADVADIEDFRSAIEDAGYSVLGVGGDEEISGNPRQIVELRTKAAFSITIAALIMGLMAIPAVRESLPFRLDILLLVLSTPVQFWAGKRFYVGAWSTLKHGTSNMNTLIAVGTSVAFGYSAAVTVLHDSWLFAHYDAASFFETSTAIVGLVLLGRYLEARAKGKASEAIKALMQSATGHRHGHSRRHGNGRPDRGGPSRRTGPSHSGRAHPRRRQGGRRPFLGRRVGADGREYARRKDRG